MSEARKYGDQNPGCPFDAPQIFRRAMEDFLWPQDRIITADRARIVASCSFALWCSWWRRASCGSFDVEPLPPVLRYIVEGVENRGADPFTEGEAMGDLCRLWRQAWSGMLDEQSETPKPRRRSATRGMKFCLIVLVLRYGLASGRLKNGSARIYPDGQERERKVDAGVSLQEVSEAASLLLAVSVLSRKGEITSVSNVPWARVDNLALIMKSPAGKRIADEKRIDGLEDFERDGVGLAGFKKLLRTTMPLMEWRKVSPLAATYGRQAGNFGQWMKDERLDNCFQYQTPDLRRSDRVKIFD